MIVKKTQIDSVEVMAIKQQISFCYVTRCCALSVAYLRAYSQKAYIAVMYEIAFSEITPATRNRLGRNFEDVG